MEKAEIAGLLASAYLVGTFIWHRVRIHRRRQRGPSLQLLACFDFRVVWDELSAGPGGSGEKAPCSDPAAGPQLGLRYGRKSASPRHHQALREQLLAGDSPILDPEDERARDLALGFAVYRMKTGSFDGAAALAARLPAALAGTMLATVELARAQRLASVHQDSAARRAISTALQHAERALRLRGEGPGLEYLLAHLQLAWLTHEANLEWSTVGTLWKLSRALKRWGSLPCLYFARAHAQALLGRHEEALDELGRALYYSQGDPFYSRAILDHGFVRHARPALFAQCKALRERHAVQSPGALSPGGVED